MAVVINMPRLSDTMEEGTVVAWLKKVGDKVEEGDMLAEIETDKATMEFESFNEGTLLYIGVAEGEGAPVDTLLAIIGEEGEDISGLLDKNAEPEAIQEEVAPKEDAVVAEPVEASGPDEIPEGVEVIKMPRLSDTMEEGTVVAWLKKVGDAIEEGDILAEIETDKATMEFESFYSGVLLYIGIKEGETSPVDEVLAIIGPEGTNVDAILKESTAASGTTENTSAENKKPDLPVGKGKKVELEVAAVAETKVVNDGRRIFASPLAKKIAKEKGVNLANVQGSGDQGRIVKKDVENHQPSQQTTVSQAPVQEVAASTALTASVAPINLPVGEEGSEEVKNSQMRKVIAKRLAESKFTAPHYYLNIEVNMGNAMASRKKINDLPETKVSFNDLVVKACAMALKKHPQVNTTWNGDTTRYNHHISIGVAVAVDEGLVVPVLKFADQMSLTQIGASVKDMAGRARNKKLTPSEMEGSTFTVSNLGMFGIVEFTSIINQPNSAILSVGAIVEKPIVENGEIVVGNTMVVTLACDHRTVDGATGAQFLHTLRAFLENPVTMLA